MWRDCNDFILPSSGRFFLQDVNRGDRRNLKIINSAGTYAANTLHAGMKSGTMSPSRPWFRLGFQDDGLAEFGPVKSWLHIVENQMRSTFLKSNLYRNVPFRDLGVFGTAALSLEEEFTERMIHTQAYPIGSYFLAKDEFGRINVFFREFQMTVRNLVNKFGRNDDSGDPDWDIFSTVVRNLYERGQYETFVSICHVICPNEDYVPGSPFKKHKRFASCYYERGMAGNSSNYMANKINDDKYLREEGYDWFPVLCPRWYVVGEDVYATDCPGITTIGDIKQLQHGEKKYGKALDKMVDPPMIAPVSLQNSKTTLLPGDFMFADVREGSQGIRSAHDVTLRLDHLDARQDKIALRISRGFYEDLFLMLAQSDRREITAREIDERHEEKLLALGPVLESVSEDIHDPLIEITFAILLKRGKIPPPPPEIQGMPLKIEFISIMAQAQKLIGVGTHERFINTVMAMLPVKPDVGDKVDFDQYIDVYGDQLSITPGVVRPDDQVEALRAARAEAMQAQQQAEQIPNIARAAKDFSQADTGGDNALAQMIRQAQGQQEAI